MEEYKIIEPCPCCGGRPVLIDGIISIDVKRIDKAVKICCEKCGLQIIKQTAAEAVNAWNKRAQSAKPGYIAELLVDALSVAASEWKTSHSDDAKTAETLKNYIINGVKFFNAGKE